MHQEVEAVISFSESKGVCQLQYQKHEPDSLEALLLKWDVYIMFEVQ